MIGRLIQAIWSGVGVVSGVVTKLVSFGTAYVGEIIGADKRVTSVTRNVGDKIGDVIVETGCKAGELAGKAWDVTTDAVAGATCAVCNGVKEVLDDEEKCQKVKKTGIAVGIAGVSLLAIGTVLYCASKKNKR